MPEITSTTGALLAVAALGYLLGSIPFGIVMARIFGLGDLRQIGSGNIGATNVLRTGNRPAAALTLVCDAGKGAAAVLAGGLALGADAAQVAGGMAFLGHLYPVWLRFRGGKGVATFLGTLLALSFPAGLAACATWLAVAAVTRYSSLAALVAAALSPVWMALLGRVDIVAVGILMAAAIFLRHEPNLKRLVRGEEPKIGRKG